LLSLFRNVRTIEDNRQNIIDVCSCILRPIPAHTEDTIYIAIHGLLESCVLGLADVLEEEDGFKEAEKEDVDTKSEKAVVPFFTGTVMARNRMVFCFGDNRGYGWDCGW
jgi:hypothetical protein